MITSTKGRLGFLSSLSFGQWFIILNYFDAMSTLLVLSSGGFESNPSMSFVLRFGPIAFVLFKVLVSTFLAAFLVNYQRILKVLVGGFSLIVLWNMFAFLVPLVVR